MMRKWMLFGLMLAASSVFATECTLEGAFGRGAAVDRNNQVGYFGFGVAEITCDDGTHHLKGSFGFQTFNRERRVAIGIFMPEVENLEVNGAENREAAFGGKAVLVIRSDRGEQRVPGTVEVHVADRRRGGQGEPDLLALRFVPEGGGDEFTFAGEVRFGDIFVGKRTIER